jgi:hypothetical protein
MIAWLIEYVGAKPSPVYVPEDFSQTRGNFTLDAWEALRFKTKAEAEEYMASPNGCMAYTEPWAAIEHGFDIRCSDCGKDCDTAYGSVGICDTCIPF